MLLHVAESLFATLTGTLDVRVRGDTLFPPSIGGRLSILFSILRQLSLVLTSGVLTSELRRLDPDVFIVDQLSSCIPLLRFLYPRARILFYGHYPDQLLLREFGSGIMRPIRMLYRIPFDFIESWTTGCADAIAVNSKFTRNVFRRTFPALRSRDLKVIYPCVDTDDAALQNRTNSIWHDKKILLSINRFECKKDLALAIKAYAGLAETERTNATLVLAGGFDPRNPENAECYGMIKNLTESLNLTHATFKPQGVGFADLAANQADVLFLLSIPHELKTRLLNSASLLVYTPSDEHFGIVPLEAMVAGVPVLATNTGGPLETVYDGRTGWLRSPNKTEAWTEVMRKVLIPSNDDALLRMGEQGRQRVQMEFSRTNMTDAFNREVQQLSKQTGPRPRVVADWVWYTYITSLVALVGAILAFFILPPSISHVRLPALRGFMKSSNGVPSNGQPKTPKAYL